MKKVIKISITLVLACFLMLYSYSQSPIFADGLGGNSDDFGYKVTKDNSGNLIITGSFSGTADFDPGPGTYNLSSSGLNDIFLAKYNSTGAFIWAFKIGGADLDYAYATTTDNTGNIYITGFFRGTADFDPSASTLNLVSNGDVGADPGYGGDIFLAKYSSTGSYLWAFNIGGSTKFDNGQDVKIDANGDVILAGYFVGTNIDFDPSSGSSFLLGNGTEDQFFAKYTASGNFIWANEIGGNFSANETIRQIITDPSGNIYITGYFTSSFDVDPGPGTVTLNASSVHQGYLAKFNTNGNYVWAYTFGGSGNNQGLAIDYYNGFIYFSGFVEGTGISFNDASGSVNLLPKGGLETFIAKYSINGDISFVKLVAGTGDEQSLDLKVNGTDNVFYITGYFTGTCDFNPSSIQNFNINAIGGQDIFVSRYLLDGTFVSAFKIGSSTNDLGNGIIVDNNDIIISGTFSGTNVDFDPNSVSTLPLTSFGTSDAYLAKYSMAVTVPSTLLNFSGNIQDNNTNLSWNLTNETELISIEIERSADGTIFNKVGSLTPKGPNTINNYDFRDDISQITASPLFYRLVLKNNNGRDRYSKMIALYNSSSNSFKLELSPNPANKWFQLNLSSKSKGIAEIALFDISGRICYKKSIQVVKGNNAIQITDISNLTPGSYTLLFQMNDLREATKIILQ